jgi:hypothetical protein
MLFEPGIQHTLIFVVVVVVIIVQQKQIEGKRIRNTNNNLFSLKFEKKKFLIFYIIFILF